MRCSPGDHFHDLLAVEAAVLDEDGPGVDAGDRAAGHKGPARWFRTCPDGGPAPRAASISTPARTINSVRAIARQQEHGFSRDLLFIILCSRGPTRSRLSKSPVTTGVEPNLFHVCVEARRDPPSLIRLSISGRTQYLIVDFNSGPRCTIVTDAPARCISSAASAAPSCATDDDDALAVGGMGIRSSSAAHAADPRPARSASPDGRNADREPRRCAPAARPFDAFRRSRFEGQTRGPFRCLLPLARALRVLPTARFHGRRSAGQEAIHDLPVVRNLWTRRLVVSGQTATVDFEAARAW